jgi:propionate CoA-transferase
MRGAAKILSAAEAVALIPNGATVAVGGFIGSLHPEKLTAALEERFLGTGSPQDLTLVYAAGQGDRESRGLNHLAHAGLVRRVVGGHWNLAPRLGKLALENKIEAYNFPQGVICTLLREIAAKRPGVFTRIGMNTFIDPRQGGGKLNECTREELVTRVHLGDEDWLWYHSFPVTVGLIRGTVADRHGNIAVGEEGLIGEGLPIAQAARNHGGLVIAQVAEVVDRIADPKSVRVPGILVDALVVVDRNDPAQWQTFSEVHNPAYMTSGGGGTSDRIPRLEFSERKVIGRRALREIPRGAVINLGIGMPEAIGAVAAEEGKLDRFTFTVESGPIGGVPASGLSFGCASHPEAIIDQPSQFDFYDGGGLDFSALGAVEIDGAGNVCVHRMAGRLAGVGGFMNIAQTARKLVFCCSFTAGGLKVGRDGGELRILQEGRHCKFVERVEEITFDAAGAFERGQEVLYVTERAVFRLTPTGLELIEVAPGIDQESQVLALMPCRPVCRKVRPMPAECFLI